MKSRLKAKEQQIQGESGTLDGLAEEKKTRNVLGELEWVGEQRVFRGSWGDGQRGQPETGSQENRRYDGSRGFR